MPAPSSCAATEAPRAVILPVATDGVVSLPSALPSATTCWPTFAVLESPIVTVLSPEAPVSWRTATSLLSL